MSAQEVPFRGKKCSHLPSVPLIKTLNHSALGVRLLKMPRLNHSFFSPPRFTPPSLKALCRQIYPRNFFFFSQLYTQSMHCCRDPGLHSPILVLGLTGTILPTPCRFPVRTAAPPLPQEAFSLPWEAGL